jgi:NADPH-dependent glutamate synthase beta subunit-like oxidoreductase/Pyruvate/2-oxoacid:ferredoxin oxidoreductase delta subunit
METIKIPLIVSQSNISTESNQTGFWRYVRPEFVQKTAPCSATCPAGEDIARIETLVRQGAFKRALETILIENPFPSVCGRVCFHTCESACNRKGFDEAVNIRCIERFLGDQAVYNRLNPAGFRFPPNGKKIAVVGAGPAGLSAAYFLAMLGYACNVFEAEEAPGGILRWGIPAYRLPVEVLEFEIERIRNCGVRINCHHLATKETFDEIKHAFDAVFVGCGNGRAVKMGIAGETEALDGLSFLADVKKGKIPHIKGPVAVIGGGNTAVDVSRTLARLGVAATILYRRRRTDMPAFSREVDLALSEGVKLNELLALIRIEKSENDFILHLQKMKVSQSNGQGRARVVAEESQTPSMRFACVITAIGARAAEPWHLPAGNGGKTIALSHCAILPGKTPVAYGGDPTNAIQSVADAVASGKQAAMALDMLIFQGMENIGEKLDRLRIGNGVPLSMEMYIGGQRKERDPHEVTFEEINPDYFAHEKRISPEYISLRALGGLNAFSQNEQTIDEPAALRESGRCFNCGICNDCDNCRLFCPEMAVVREEGQFREVCLDYCKGCGICVAECPRSAMVLKEEQR